MAKYYKLSKLADILTIDLLKNNGDIFGDFLEEENSPNFWFKEKYSLFQNKPLNFESGTPINKTKKVSWLDLFKKITVIDTKNNHLSDEIIIISPDKKVLTEIIHKHFLIQRGEISYSYDGKNWLIKINYPSVWIISLIQDNYKIYNRVQGLETIYLEKGAEVKEFYHIRQNYNLSIPVNQYVFINLNGEIKSFNIDWKSANKTIEIINDDKNVFVANENVKVEITPKLVKSYGQKYNSLWYTDNTEKLKKIINNYGSENLNGFKAWFNNNETAYIISLNNYNDSGLISLFNDAFTGFYKHKEKVFFEGGLVLMPLLDESRLFDIYNINPNDYLIFNNINENMEVTVLPDKDLKPLSSFIVYRTEKSINQIESFSSQWKFDFGELKKKRQIILIDDSELEDSEFYKKAQTKKVQKTKTGVQNLPKVKKEVDASEWTRLRNEIYKIDNDLLEDITNSELWLERSNISNAFDNNSSAIVAKLTSDIIEKDLNSFLQSTEQYINNQENSEFKNSLKINDENSKGKVLLEIRNKISSAELDFAYQLYFSKKFKDSDVFDYAVNTMIKGYSNTNRNFHEFEEKSFGKTSDDTAVINSESFENIKNNISEFIDILDNYQSEYKNIVLRQFKIMLDSNLPFDIDNILNIEKVKIDSSEEALLRISKLIDNYPALPDDAKRSTEKWFSLIEMKNIKSVPIKDFFTGEIYRSSFASDFDPVNETKDIYESYLNNELLLDNISEQIIDKNKSVINTNIKKVFSNKGSELERAKSQRILLHLITEYGPLKDFQKMTLTPEYNNSFYNIIVMNCDIYRINLRYGIKIDENTFFENLINSVSGPFVSIIDFKDAIENIIFCLFISQSPRRKEFLNIILEKCMNWFVKVSDDNDFIEEILTTISFLEASILLDDIPDSIAEYNFKARRNSLWIEYAAFLKNNYKKFLEI